VIFGMLPFDPLPDPAPAAPPGATAVVSNVFAAMKWGGLVLAVVCLIVVAGTYAVKNQRGEGGQLFTGLAGVALLVLVVSGAVTIVGWIAS